MNLLYLTFGNSPGIYWQAGFSILSFLAKDWQGGQITVMTDCPAAYALFGERLKTIAIDGEQLRSWRGPTDNFFRAKIKALEACIAQSDGEDWLYLDTDTFLSTTAQPLRALLADGNPLLHLKEGRLSALQSKTIRQLWAHTRGRSFGGIHFGEEAAMWNAGVIGIPGRDAKATIGQVLALCDELCQTKIRPRLLEQLSFSMVLAELGGLRAADHCVTHYWTNKAEWEQAIAAFFTDCFLEKLDFDGVLGKMRTFDLTKIPVYRKQRKTKQRLQAWAGQLFPDDTQHLKNASPL